MADTKSGAGLRRGENANKPSEIPPKGWEDIFRRVARSTYEKNFVVIGAGLGFFAFLSIFPMLMAIVSIYGLMANPEAVEKQLLYVGEILPVEVRSVIFKKLEAIVSTPPQNLGMGVAFSIIGSLWAASKAVNYLFMSLNVAYGVREKRSFVRLKLTSFLFTLGLVGFVILSVSLVAILPALAGVIGLQGLAEMVIRIGRWPFLAASTMFTLALLYRYGPDRLEAKWRWISPGVCIATGAWLLGSSLFSLYVTNFARFNEIYGSIGTFIVVMLWFFLSCFVILLGAAVNAEAEQQTYRDSKIDCK